MIELENGQQMTAKLETVDDRIRRLEQAVSAIQNTALMEEHVAERVVGRLLSGVDPDGVEMTPLAPQVVASAALPAMANRAGDEAVGTIWNRFQPLKELRLIFMMYFDPRYRLSRLAQIGVPVVLGLMFLNYLLLGTSSIPILAWVFLFFEHMVLIVLAVVLYKILAREVIRYEAVLKYLARYHR